jgi:endonuclease III-like uncharacterized protein
LATISDKKFEFYKQEFNRICKLDKWDFEKILSIKNFKSQSVMLISTDIKQEIGEQIKYINRNLKKDGEKSIKNVIKKLCSINGIGFSTATTILAVAKRKEFAILDSRIISFMKKNDFVGYIEKKFKVDLKNVTWFSEWKSKTKPHKINTYIVYLNILKEIKKKNRTYIDLRKIEFKIFKDSYNY